MPHWRKGVCFTAGSTTETKSSRSLPTVFSHHTMTTIPNKYQMWNGDIFGIKKTRLGYVLLIYIFFFVVGGSSSTSTCWQCRHDENTKPHPQTLPFHSPSRGARKLRHHLLTAGGVGRGVRGNSVGSGACCAFMPQKVLESFGVIFLQNHWFYQV